MLCRQWLPPPIDPAPSGRAKPRPGTKFGVLAVQAKCAHAACPGVSPPASSPIRKRRSARSPPARARPSVVARSRQPRALREIAERGDLYLLKDIGVSQEEVLREADKPFWRR